MANRLPRLRERRGGTVLARETQPTCAWEPPFCFHINNNLEKDSVPLSGIFPFLLNSDIFINRANNGNNVCSIYNKFRKNIFYDQHFFLAFSSMVFFSYNFLSYENLNQFLEKFM